MAAGPKTLSLCQFRVETARCVFVEGHPGAHVCIRPHGSSVPIRGEGEIPETTYLWRRSPSTGAQRTAEPVPISSGGEDVRGLWTEGMVARLLTEIHEAGVYSPADWIANLPRLRAEAGRAEGATGTRRRRRR